jgi:mannose-6-phosphate isomerase-like protein (cupin superfamily)
MREQIRHLQPQAEYYFVEGCHINELLNAPDDAAVSIARARVAPGVATRWHRLRDIVERYVIVSGKGRVEIGDLPGEDVTAGAVVLIPPLCRQRITNTGDEDLVFLAICSPRFRPEAYEDIEG